MKKLLFLFAIAGVMNLLFAAPTAPVSKVAATGDKAPELAASAWLDGKEHKLADFRGKQNVVLLLWEYDQRGVAALPVINALYNRCDVKENAFLGIICTAPENLKKFPGAEKLPFPVGSDPRRSIAKLYLRSYDILPMAVVIDREGRINWRGRLEVVPRVLAQLKAGKFDLAEKIRVERFSDRVGTAIRAKDFEQALKLVRAEWDTHVENDELVALQLRLLVHHLKRPDDAFALIALAHKKRPDAPALFQLELQLIRRTKRTALLEEFTRRLIAAVQGQPMIMLRFVSEELSRPAGELRTEAVRDMLSAAWKKGKFKDDHERAVFAIEYAKFMHNFGRADLAAKLTGKAAALFTDAKERDGAKAAMIYYQKVQKIAPTLKLE